MSDVQEAKESLTQEVAREGVALDVIKDIQTQLSETTEAPIVQAADIEGAANIPSMSNEELTKELVELKRRFNNLVMLVADGRI